jgi:hypothetical protein
MDTNEKVSSQLAWVQIECRTPKGRTRKMSTVQMAIECEWIIFRNNPCQPATHSLPTYITERSKAKKFQYHNTRVSEKHKTHWPKSLTFTQSVATRLLFLSENKVLR